MAITGFLAAINQERLILGKQVDENTPATTGFFSLNASKLLPKRESRFDTYRGAGSKVVGVSRQNTEHATLALSGGLDYNELGFFIDMALKNLTSAAVSGSAGAYSHTANLAYDAENVINWYTAFWGKGDYFRRVTGLRGEGFGFKGTRTGKMEIMGNFFGQRVEDSLRDTITLPVGTPTAVTKAPLTGLDVGIRIVSDPTDFATAPLIPTALSWEWLMAAIAVPVFSYNRSLGFEGSVEGEEPKGTIKTLLPINEDVFEIVESVKNGEVHFIQFEAIGPKIGETVSNHGFKVETPFLFETMPDDKKEQSVLGIEIPAVFAEDADFAAMTKIELINTHPSY
jgi:hypothetical protein